MKVQPWISWDPKIAKSPDWWRAYNNVKHERDECFSDANQENTLKALCGLLSLCFIISIKTNQIYSRILNFWITAFPKPLRQVGVRNCQEHSSDLPGL